MRYCLLTDDDGHCFVVPVERAAEFHAIFSAIYAYWERPLKETLHSEPPTIPTWAHAVGGAPSLVTFENPMIGGKAL